MRKKRYMQNKRKGRRIEPQKLEKRIYPNVTPGKITNISPKIEMCV